MNNITDNEFKVMNYIHRPNDINHMPIIDLSKQIEEAIKWSVDAMRTIIIPTADLEDLESQWIKFNEMPKKHRRESDWKSLELFGVTNQTNYEAMRSTILGNDIENEIEKEFDTVNHKAGSSWETENLNFANLHTISAGDIPVSEGYIDTFMNDDYYHLRNGDTFRLKISIITDVGKTKRAEVVIGTEPVDARVRFPQMGKNMFDVYVMNSKRITPAGSSSCKGIPESWAYYCTGDIENGCSKEKQNFTQCTQKVIDDGWQIKYSY